MLIYCLKHTKKTNMKCEFKSFKNKKLQNNVIINMCFILQQKIKIYESANGLLSTIGLKTLLNKILLLGKILF